MLVNNNYISMTWEALLEEFIDQNPQILARETYKETAVIDKRVEQIYINDHSGKVVDREINAEKPG